MKASVWILCFAVALGCAEERDRRPPLNEPSITDFPKGIAEFVGTWNVVGDTAGEGHTGTLELKENGTFESVYHGSKTTDRSEGTYFVSEEMGSKVLLLTIVMYNGEYLLASPKWRLFYDPSEDTLTDKLTVCFGRRAGGQSDS